MTMELGLKLVFIRGHPVDDELWLGVPLISKCLAWQWQDSDFSTCQERLPVQAAPPDTLIYDIMHFHYAKTQSVCLHNGESNTLRFPGAFMSKNQQTIQGQQCHIWTVSMTQITVHSNDGSSEYLTMPRNVSVPSWWLDSFTSEEPWREVLWHRFGRLVEWDFPYDMCWPKQRKPEIVRWRGLSYFSGTPNGENWFGVWGPGTGILSSPLGLDNHRFHDTRTGSLPPVSRSPCDLWEPLQYIDGFVASGQNNLAAGSRPFPAPQPP